MSLLIYSPRCKHSMDIIDFINVHPQLKQLVQYHNINTQGIPSAYQNKITRVPTMLTKNGKFLVGGEIKNWLDSLIPTKEVNNLSFGGNVSLTSLDEGENDTELFTLDSYGVSLQPAMTKELEEKISQDVSKGAPYTQQV